MPSQDITIDESLLKWHGRLSFAQKIATRANKVGVKTYELCESSTGYLWKIFIHVGRGENEQNNQPNDSSEASANNKPIAKIVYGLVYRGHTLILDHFYNSPLLLRCLKKNKTDCFGTVRLNREFLPDSIKTLTKTDLRPGEIATTNCNDMSVMVWRDANLVSLISTYHHREIGRRKKYRRIDFKPQIVLDYNKSMVGVDKKDAFLSAEPAEGPKRDRIWYKKVFRRLFYTALFNCFVIFESRYPKVSHRQFRTKLVEDLLKIHQRIDLAKENRFRPIKSGASELSKTTMRPNTSRSKHERPMVDHEHFPVRTGKKQSRSWLCSQRKVTARTIWKCSKCDVNLCIENCFRAYHK